MIKTLPFKIVTILLSFLLFTGCSHLVLPPLSEEETPRTPSNGLLAGRIHWLQEGREIVKPGPEGSVTHIVIENFKTGDKYPVDISGTDFQIPVPPGQYRLYEASILNTEVAPLESHKLITFVVGMVFVALIVASYAYGKGHDGSIPVFWGGGGGETHPKSDLFVPFYRYEYAPFNIKESEATWIGLLTINDRRIKETGSSFFLSPNAQRYEITVSEEGEEALSKELQLQFPSIRKIEKHLLEKERKENL